ncbi:MAG: hypothetical protein JNK82_33280 [Myxococcaceae bacterium]|nr:hypothetical protein [Myxococcaceae bacterium]
MSYEFNSTEDATLQVAGSRAGAWGGISVGLGIIQLLLGGWMFSSGKPGLPSLVSGIVSIVIGAMFLGVGGSLKNIVATKGNDVGHLMEAMKKLTTALTVQIVVTTVGFAIGFIAGAMGGR